MSWPEVVQAKEEHRHELVLSGSDVSQRISKKGLDDGIYELHALNFLEISKTSLTVLSESLGELSNLTNLQLRGNKLQSLPASIGKLVKIKFLDVSSNEIQELPDEISEMKELESLNVSCNSLTSFLHIGSLHRLHILDISHNQLTSLPDGVNSNDLVHLAQILASNNAIEDIPADLSDLPSLKTIDVENNRLVMLPPELSGCPKLKEFNYRGNKLKDRRVAKMMDQCSTKAVLDYLRGQMGKGGGGGGKGKGKKGKGKKGGGFAEEVCELSENIMNLLRFPDSDGIEVHVSNAVADVRPYIVCCIVRDLDLSSNVNTFKKFITMQTKLHDGVCAKRQSATIATHDLAAVKSPIKYDARIPATISLVPLFRSKNVTADQLVAKLWQEAEDQRKEKKRNTVSGIHKYLSMVHEKPLYACLMDNEETVISFPPITNCDVTKVSKDTKDILIEVTSTLTLDTCKKVLDEMLKMMLEMGLGTGGQASAASGDGLLLEGQKLIVEQVKIVDPEGTMKVVYPSRTDLQGDGFKVIKNYE